MGSPSFVFITSRLGAFLRTQATHLTAPTTGPHGRAPTQQSFPKTPGRLRWQSPSRTSSLSAIAPSLSRGCHPKGFADGECGRSPCSQGLPSPSCGLGASPLAGADGGTRGCPGFAAPLGCWLTGGMRTRHRTALCLSLLSCKRVLKQ